MLAGLDIARNRLDEQLAQALDATRGHNNKLATSNLI